jgi:hypothetical protein
MLDDEAWEAELVRSGRTERDKNRPRPTSPAKWTKKEIKSLCGSLDTFWLKHRPIDSFLSHEAEGAVAVRDHLALERHRTHAVLAGIRQFVGLHSSRYRSACESIGNALARPHVYGKGTDEHVAHCIEMAREHDDDRMTTEAILHKVLDYGLPPEAIAYDPTAPQR